MSNLYLPRLKTWFSQLLFTGLTAGTFLMATSASTAEFVAIDDIDFNGTVSDPTYDFNGTASYLMYDWSRD